MYLSDSQGGATSFDTARIVPVLAQCCNAYMQKSWHYCTWPVLAQCSNAYMQMLWYYCTGQVLDQCLLSGSGRNIIGPAMAHLSEVVADGASVVRSKSSIGPVK